MSLENLSTPCYVVDEGKLIKNLELLKKVQDLTGCKILLAQKCFSMFKLYPLIGQYLAGATASGIYEARLGHEEMGKENHVFAPAFRTEDMQELVKICDHIIFNSFAQFEKHKELCKGVSVGIRVNPQCSTQDHAIYDPCSPGSRLGVTLDQFPEELPKEIEGLHFHTLCEQNADDLITTFKAFEEKFGKYFGQLKWINLGGGHHITRKDYDRERLVRIVKHLKDTYQVEVYLEPGEAVVLNAGFLVTSVLEMPYRPPLKNSGESGEKAYTYRLGGPTCLAGDVIGDYSFDAPLNEGDRLVFEDMALYTMVKTNTFNGMPLPAIVWRDANGQEKLVKAFGYEDFKNRLS